MAASTKEDVIDIHALIQQEKYDLYALVCKHREQIDDHVETCEECRERVEHWTTELSKLRARMTVNFPAPANDHERIEQLQKLKAGQCLPCGCRVIESAWTRDYACEQFYKAFAEILQVPEDAARRIPLSTQCTDLPLSVKSLRRLRDRFWIPDGSSGSEKRRDAEEGEKVLQLPETIGAFIKELLDLHSGVSYSDCSEHWSPG